MYLTEVPKIFKPILMLNTINSVLMWLTTIFNFPISRIELIIGLMDIKIVI